MTQAQEELQSLDGSEAEAAQAARGGSAAPRERASGSFRLGSGLSGSGVGMLLRFLTPRAHATPRPAAGEESGSTPAAGRTPRW